MYTEDDLVAGVKNGSSTAVRHLLSEYQHYMYTICYNVLRNREEAEEATQDSFLKVIKAIPHYTKNGKLTTWMYAIAYRTSLDYLKKRKHTISLENIEISIENNQSDHGAKNDKLERINTIINELPPEDAGLIRVYYMEQMSVKELSDYLGQSESNVKVRLHRIRKKIALMAQKPQLEKI